jgi:hypothetical protein
VGAAFGLGVVGGETFHVVEYVDRLELVPVDRITHLQHRLDSADGHSDRSARLGRNSIFVAQQPAFVSIETDSHGRLYLTAELREKYGETFHIVEYADRLELVPIDENPLRAVREEVGDALDGTSREELREEALDRAKQEAAEDQARRDATEDQTRREATEDHEHATEAAESDG